MLWSQCILQSLSLSHTKLCSSLTAPQVTPVHFYLQGPIHAVLHTKIFSSPSTIQFHYPSRPTANFSLFVKEVFGSLSRSLQLRGLSPFFATPQDLLALLSWHSCHLALHYGWIISLSQDTNLWHQTPYYSSTLANMRKVSIDYFDGANLKRTQKWNGQECQGRNTFG